MNIIVMPADGEPIGGLGEVGLSAASGAIANAWARATGTPLHPVQRAWIERDAAQCGFCQPGQIMAAVDLLRRTRNLTDTDIDAIENVCRCGTCGRIREGVEAAAAMMPQGRWGSRAVCAKAGLAS